jgi:lysophospholipase L1-like esterase
MKIFLCALLNLILMPAALQAESLLKPNDVVAICGDSITQRQVYSAYIEDYLLMCQPVPGIRTVQFGSNGAGAYVLGKKTPHDLAYFHPTVVTMMYGMNDGQYKPLNDERANSFRQGTLSSLDALKMIGVRTVVVGSPSCVDWVKNVDDGKMYNTTLASLGDISREIAQQQNLVFADIHAEMAAAIAKGEAASPGFNVGGDGTHVGPAGHLMIAYALLKGMGLDGAVGTITVDLAANKAVGSPGQKIVSVSGGTVEIESTRYPFCFLPNPPNYARDITTASVLPFLPFNVNLNRYLLVVHGLTSAHAKVTWGTQSSEFPRADLEKGINLADVFPIGNPFADQFAKVDAAVHEQQTQETRVTWEYLTDANAALRLAIPSQTATLDQIQNAALDRCTILAKAAVAQVIPVHHTITIEAIP